MTWGTIDSMPDGVVALTKIDDEKVPEMSKNCAGRAIYFSWRTALRMSITPLPTGSGAIHE